jgi:hypothetical protein
MKNNVKKNNLVLFTLKIQLIMKKTILFLLLVASMFLSSCGKYYDGTSVWAGGAFLVFWIPFIGSFVFLYFAYKASKSGSVQTTRERGREEFDKNIPIYKVGQFYFFVALQIFSWIVVIVQNVNK